jgi:hypothetical protein
MKNDVFSINKDYTSKLKVIRINSLQKKETVNIKTNKKFEQKKKEKRNRRNGTEGPSRTAQFT